MRKSQKQALIIGAGPAGLTAAWELLQHTDIHPIVVEQQDYVGGLSATIEHRGNAMDIGGHRFFSKSPWVMQWWQNMMPLQTAAAPASPEALLKRQRRSRILYLGQLFNYPLSLSLNTLRQLGIQRLLRVAVSYLGAQLHPIKPERSLEDFFINRFGRELYRTFFKSYTEKVWGVPCQEIDPSWGPQRVKGVSVRSLLANALVSPFRSRAIEQNSTETSLIEQFIYPARGPGQMWQRVADRAVEGGAQLRLQHRVVAIETDGNKVCAATLAHGPDGQSQRIEIDFVISTMPVKTLIASLSPPPPSAVTAVAEGLRYRDMLVVGVLIDPTSLPTQGKQSRLQGMEDNWLYIQEPHVQVGRIQLFHNWSPYLVAQSGMLWLGMEYFCQQGDALWALEDSQLALLATAELEKLGLATESAITDHHVLRVPYAYPAYFGSYGSFDRIRSYTDRIDNLYLIGRNGTHRYNNQDHSMITAREAVRLIRRGLGDRSSIWAVNSEEDYHEEH
ncbi:NAD(P)/FAD-dependent oxidoreductase [Aestuariirhabdus sp. LZHN29]|uniref:NAD(P)/FAD-dependent oxidoreductase n=1 Tax=Aestuariirhabdus sp. LZHN29 TaxID=3417462 RepID=UPI003CEE261C